jgi:hypothetical protein
MTSKLGPFLTFKPDSNGKLIVWSGFAGGPRFFAAPKKVRRKSFESGIEAAVADAGGAYVPALTGAAIGCEKSNAVAAVGKNGHFGRVARKRGLGHMSICPSVPDMAQWCFPSRRQQTGKPDVALVNMIAAISGKLNATSIRNARVRRIGGKCLTP